MGSSYTVPLGDALTAGATNRVKYNKRRHCSLKQMKLDHHYFLSAADSSVECQVSGIRY